ncbi:acyltransferase family protein [Acidicapsa dinghuensis]|uniref:Acyltransferase family protein n=1 Tax=Acidicapsa dinghuensis TaxID=2218256 RepID=A0ABW1EAH0_9BACT|nr:heparan-alpha-glucosaminide N-acetyltransferase domain-containing protein [Acidicapsa dinghuensis]
MTTAATSVRSTNPDSVTVSAPGASSVRRLLSLDALRGLTIAFMIMVNNNGSDKAWWFMKHIDWNGMTPTDLVFPTFLFVVGVSIVLAYEARLAKGSTRAHLAAQTVKRAIVLFLFGEVVNGFPYFHLGTLRIYGVLQRIAVCYLIAGLFYLWDSGWKSKAAVLIGALVSYWIIMRWAPVPGLGIPTPGLDHVEAGKVPFLDRDANMVAWLDRHIFPGRLYEGTRDPEGLLSDLPALGTALLGVLAGIWLRSKHTLESKANGIAGGAATCLAIGYIWSFWFPLNKKLWTSSYVLIAGGISLAILALFYWMIEVRGWKGKWTWPWLVFGSNAIAAYMISELLGSTLDLIGSWIAGHRFGTTRWIFIHWFAWIPNDGLASFAYSFAYMAVCFIPVWILYKKKIFLKV